MTLALYTTMTFPTIWRSKLQANSEESEHQENYSAPANRERKFKGFLT